jgi:hypothetical protein
VAKITLPAPTPEKIDAEVWKMLSSDHSTFYYIFCWPNGTIDCTCPGYKYRVNCKHVDRVIEMREST